MPLPLALLPQRATHKRLSSSLLIASTLPFSSAATWEHTEPAHVQIVATVGGMTVSVSGTLNGSTQNEIITVGGSGVARGALTWTAVTAISSVSISGASLSVNMTWPSGQPAVTPQTITSDVPIRKQEHRFPLLVEGAQGQILKQRWLAFTNDFDARSGDTLDIGSDQFQIEAVEQIYAKNTFHHLELELHKLT